ncbi:hypothetical protein [Planktotalea sp.]|uniref:hypothetical protein n=1 Tax=Planktotalea sp. TaxID=2029877 RepID=UPI00329951A4
MTAPVDAAYRYRAYGCNIVSDIPFENLTEGADPSRDTITIRRCDSLPDAPKDARAFGNFGMAGAQYLSLNIDGFVRFSALNGNTLLYCPHETATNGTLQVFLLGSGLGTILAQRDFLVLHGNAVEIDGCGMVCVGPSGAGKSTTAAGLMQRGFRVISDDVCAIDAQGQIVPGIPYFKLWQDAASGLNIETTGLSRVHPQLEKYRVAMADAFCADPVDVRMIFVLARSGSQDFTCETLTGHAKFTALRANTYRLEHVEGMGLAERHFQQLHRLSQRITVKRIGRPVSGFHLDQLLDFLLTQARSKATT